MRCRKTGKTLGGKRLCFGQQSFWLVLLVLFLTGCKSEDPGDLFFHRAQNAVFLKRMDWARVYFQQDLADYPQRAATLLGLLHTQSEGDEGSRSDAIQAGEAYLTLVPDDIKARLLVAKLALSLGKRGLSQSHLEVLPGSPERDAAWAAFWQYEKPEEALVAARRAIEAGYRNMDLLFLAVNLALQADRASEAESWALLALQTYPLMPRFHYLFARVLRQSGDPQGADRANHHFAQLKRLNEPGSALRKGAAEQIRVFMEVKPHLASNHPQVELYHAKLLLNNNQWEAASSILKTLSELPALDSKIRLQVGELAKKNRMFAIAEAAYSQDQDVEARALLGLAQVKQAQGQVEQALALWQEGLEKHPQHAAFAFALGNYFSNKGELEKAERYLDEALHLAPFWVPYRIATIKICQRLGKTKKVRDLVAGSPKRNPQWNAFLKAQDL